MVTLMTSIKDQLLECPQRNRLARMADGSIGTR
jgi:hypothetical protein